MRNFITSLAYIAAFFGSIGGVLFSAYMLVQAEYGLLPLAEFAPGSIMTAQQFAVYTFATLALGSMLCAFAVLAMLDRRNA